MYSQVQELFKGATDLLDEFKQFLPDNSNKTTGPIGSIFTGFFIITIIANHQLSTFIDNASKQAAIPVFPNSLVGKKGFKRSASGGYIPYTNEPSNPQPTKRKKAQEEPSNLEELEFFEKVKKITGNKSTYNEFLKILNLFSQEIIDARTLVERVSPFLDRSPELLDWFKRFVKFEAEEIIGFFVNFS